MGKYFTILFSRLQSTSRTHVRYLEPALLIVCVFLPAISMEESSSPVMVQTQRAQEIVDTLRTALPINNEVQVTVVVYHPFVFSVEPMDQHKDRYLLSMELGFLLMLDDDELRAALAHELGHVWVFTHHPYLQTERMVNMIGQRVVDRAAFERVYFKLWAYEGTSGVSMDDLLGPPSETAKIPRP
jgi:hypothetical protein